MLELIRFGLLVVGLVYIVTQSSIFTIMRMLVVRTKIFMLAQLFYCPACMGFWMGLGLGALGYWPLATHAWWMVLLESALTGTAVGAVWKEYGPQIDVWSLEVEPLMVEAGSDEEAES